MNAFTVVTSKSENDCSEVTRSFVALLIERKTNNQDTNKYDQDNHAFHRRMRLPRDSLRIHSGTGFDGALSLSRLTAIQRRPILVVRHRPDGSFQALARLAPQI